MTDKLRARITLSLALTCTVGAIGVPVHGHTAHAGHEQAHIEVGHHDHDSAYVQGEARLITRAPRVAVLAGPVLELPPEADLERREDPLRVEQAVGRAPPDPASPRAPPA